MSQTKSKTEIIRDFMGASIEAAREAIGIAKYAVKLQLEANEMLTDILRLMGEKDAKAEQQGADIAALQKQVQDHERRIPPTTPR
jgi:hypothetical protein